MEDLRFRRDVQQMAVVLFLGVVVASTTAEQTLLSNFNEAKARMNERDASCISVAAELSPCLSVCSPLSRLTTMEEADCCTTLLLFKEVDCYCLAQESIQELRKADRCALRKRLIQLANANRHCGWEAVTDFAPETTTHRIAEEKLEETSEGSKSLETDLKRFYGVSADQRCQEVGVCGGLSQPVNSFAKLEQRNALLNHPTAYMKQAVTLTEALSMEQDDEASWGVPWLSLVILALLVTLLIRVGKLHPANHQPLTACQYAGQEIVVAAEEVRSLRKH